MAEAEALIRGCIEDTVKALNAKDIDGVMSLYAPNIVSFDIVPPLRYFGAENKRRAWQEAFAAYTGPFDYELHDTLLGEGQSIALMLPAPHDHAHPRLHRSERVEPQPSV